MNRVRTEEETGIEEEKSESIPVFVCVKRIGDGGGRQKWAGGPTRTGRAAGGTTGCLRIDGWRLRY